MENCLEFHNWSLSVYLALEGSAVASKYSNTTGVMSMWLSSIRLPPPLSQWKLSTNGATSSPVSRWINCRFWQSADLWTALKITKEAYVRFTIQFSSIAKPDCPVYIDTHVAIAEDRTSGKHLACRGATEWGPISVSVTCDDRKHIGRLSLICVGWDVVENDTTPIDICRVTTAWRLCDRSLWQDALGWRFH